MPIYLIADVVATLIEYADELKAKSNLDAVEFGTLLGYAEALSIIHDVCSPEQLEELGLNFDVDARYFLPK